MGCSSRERLESYQKRQILFMRLCNKFSNPRRIPWAVKKAGEAARLAYLKARALMMALFLSPAGWVQGLG